MKNLKQYAIGFIAGGLLFGTIGVTAASVLASVVSYDTNAKSQVGASTVQEALDELYDMAGSVYQGYNSSGYSSFSQNVSSLTSNYNLFVKHTMKASDTTNPNKKEVCIFKNNELGCFKPEYTEAEKSKMQTFFSDGSCEVEDEGTACTSGDFECCIYSDVYVECSSVRLSCRAGFDGDFGCIDEGSAHSNPFLPPGSGGTINQ